MEQQEINKAQIQSSKKQFNSRGGVNMSSPHAVNNIYERDGSSSSGYNNFDQ